MSQLVITFQTITVSSGGTNSTGLDCSDASAVWFALNSTTTAGTNVLNVEVSMSTKGTSDTDATFFPLGVDSTAGSIQSLSSAVGRVISPVTFRMIRVAATAAVGASSGYSVQAGKAVLIVV